MNDNIAYYDKLLADIYDIIYSEGYIGKQTIAEVSFIKKYLKKEYALLDIGCGTGRHLTYWSKHVSDIVGIDSSKQMLHYAKKKFPTESTSTLSLTQSGIENFETSKQFDVAVMLFTVANHITSQDLQKGFTNVCALLKKKGVFIFDLTNFYSFLDSYKPESVRTYKGNAGEIVIRSNKHTVDGYRQQFINDEQMILVRGKEAAVYSARSKLQMYSVNEVTQMLHRAGLQNIKTFSDWKHTKNVQTKRHIFVCKK